MKPYDKTSKTQDLNSSLVICKTNPSVLLTGYMIFRSLLLWNHSWSFFCTPFKRSFPLTWNCLWRCVYLLQWIYTLLSWSIGFSVFPNLEIVQIFWQWILTPLAWSIRFSIFSYLEIVHDAELFGSGFELFLRGV